MIDETVAWGILAAMVWFGDLCCLCWIGINIKHMVGFKNGKLKKELGKLRKKLEEQS